MKSNIPYLLVQKFFLFLTLLFSQLKFIGKVICGQWERKFWSVSLLPKRIHCWRNKHIFFSTSKHFLVNCCKKKTFMLRRLILKAPLKINDLNIEVERWKVTFYVYSRTFCHVSHHIVFFMFDAHQNLGSVKRRFGSEVLKF